MANPDTAQTTDTTADTTAEGHSVVLRIVVYGPASAGKTTTARALGEGFGRTVSTPVQDDDGATVYFDWMEHVGGVYQGRPILTQVITVPGHDRSRRLALLCQADVVIYVADTSPAGMIESLALWEELAEELQRLGTSPGIVIQANKRDHPAAVSLPTFRSWMALDDDQTVVETVASNGNGVRQAYVFAVRKGLQRIATHAELAAEAVPLDPERVLADLSTVESEATPDRRSVTAAPTVPAPVEPMTSAPATAESSDRRAEDRPADASLPAYIRPATTDTTPAAPFVERRATPATGPADVAPAAEVEPTAAAPAPTPESPIPPRPTALTPEPTSPVAEAPAPSTPAPTSAPTGEDAGPVPGAEIAEARRKVVDPVEIPPALRAPSERVADTPTAADTLLPPPPPPGSLPLPPPPVDEESDTTSAGTEGFLGRLFRGRRP